MRVLLFIEAVDPEERNLRIAKMLKRSRILKIASKYAFANKRDDLGKALGGKSFAMYHAAMSRSPALQSNAHRDWHRDKRRYSVFSKYDKELLRNLRKKR